MAIGAFQHSTAIGAFQPAAPVLHTLFLSDLIEVSDVASRSFEMGRADAITLTDDLNLVLPQSRYAFKVGMTKSTFEVSAKPNFRVLSEV